MVVVGVSERPDNLAREIVENLFEFQFNGEIFFVGKSGGILFGRRICTSMEDLPEGIDVAVILTPASTTLSSLARAAVWSLAIWRLPSPVLAL